MRHDLNKPLGRLIAWLDMHLVDHGLIRTAYNNFYPLGGGMYRLSQPSPAQLRRYRDRYGIRTVINLRGENRYGSYFYEEEACRELGIELINLRLFARFMPTVEQIRSIKELFDRISYPALMHCKSGADRAGMGSMLYRHFRMGDPIAGLDQLHWKYGHFQFGDTGSLDYFFRRYLLENEGMSLMDWVEQRYDRDAMISDFGKVKKSIFGTWFIDKLLRR